MKRVLIAASLGLALTGCDGDIIKSMARAVLADEINQNQQQVAQQQVQQPVATDPNAQLQPVQPVTTTPVQPTTQAQQPVQQPVQQPAQVQTAPIQQPTTIIVQADQPQPQQTVKVVKQARPVNFVPTHYIMTNSDGYVFMRSQPDASAKKTTKLFDGTYVQQLSCTSDYTTRTDEASAGDEGFWCKVRTQNGSTGYVFSAYLY